MVYNPNIPAAGDALSVSQGQIQTNFSDANTYFAVNHEAFDAVSNNGKHKAIVMTQQLNPTVAATDAAVFTKAGTYNTNPQVFFRQGATNTIFNATEASLGTTGWAYLPCGLLTKWGESTPTGNPTTVTYPTGGTIPAFATIYRVFITIAVASTAKTFSLIEGSLSTTQFQYSVGSISASDRIYYLAIGV